MVFSAKPSKLKLGSISKFTDNIPTMCKYALEVTNYRCWINEMDVPNMMRVI